MQFQEFVENKETPLEPGQYSGHILALLGLRQTAGSTTTFNILLPFPFYVGKQWRDSYKPTIFVSIVKYDLVGDRGNELHIELLEFAPAH
jgi:hypothetical protein